MVTVLLAAGGSVGRVTAVALPVVAITGCTGDPEDCEERWKKCCEERGGTPSKEGNTYRCQKDLGSPWGDGKVECTDTNGDGGITPATECKCYLWLPSSQQWVEVSCADFPDEDPRKDPGPLCQAFLTICDP
jgi:hypothetical protein